MPDGRTHFQISEEILYLLVSALHAEWRKAIPGLPVPKTEGESECRTVEYRHVFVT